MMTAVAECAEMQTHEGLAGLMCYAGHYGGLWLLSLQERLSNNRTALRHSTS